MMNSSHKTGLHSQQTMDEQRESLKIEQRANREKMDFYSLIDR